MKEPVQRVSAQSNGRKRGIVIRATLAIVALTGSIALALTLLGTFSAFAAGVKETPTQANPWGVVLDKAGHIWVAEPGCDAEPNCLTTFPSYIGEYTRSSEALVKNYLEPTGYSSPVFLAMAKSGGVWFTEPTTNAIGQLIPGTTPHWKQWTVPTASANPYDLLFDKNGNIWFTEYTGNKIGFFSPATKKFVETTVPTAISHPYGITMDVAGNIWFAENNTMQIASFTPTTTGAITIKEYAVAPLNNPHLITSDAAGNIWYSEGFSGYIGEFTPQTGVYKNIDVSVGLCTPPTPGATPTACPGTHISGIAVDSKGRIWFDDSLSARVGNYDPATGVTKTLTLMNTGAHPYNGLAVDAGNNTWFTEEYGGPTGSLGEIPAGTL
ncbi:MAG: virginiamycin B lyase family protein [Ktedonobacteraceae bacterium]